MDSSYQQNNPFDDNNDPSRNNNADESNKKNHSKKGKGRQKIPIEKIQNETKRQVTFSKRRLGLFKKASELHTLCGAENAIVVFSPSGKAHSFGAPNIQTITDQFLSQTSLGTTRFNQMHDNPIICQHNTALTNLEKQFDDEKKKKKEHARTRKVRLNQIEYPPNIDLLDFNQLQALKDKILGLKNALTTVKGASPDVGGSGPSVGYPMGLNIQGPTSHKYNMNNQFYYGNNGTMLNAISPFIPDDGLINYQTAFDFRVNNNNTNNPNSGYMNDANNNSNSATFFPAMVTNNHAGYSNETTNNNSAYQFPPHPNDHEAGGSSRIMFFNNEEVPNQDENCGEDGEDRCGGANDYVHDNYGGFNNYNNFGYGN